MAKIGREDTQAGNQAQAASIFCGISVQIIVFVPPLCHRSGPENRGGGYKDNILAKFWYIDVRNGVYRLAAPINIVF